MKLSVYSLKKVIFQGDAKELNCKTAVGEITILDNHEPYMTAMAQGTAKIVDEQNKDHFFEVSSGFLEVKPENEVRCIVKQ